MRIFIKCVMNNHEPEGKIEFPLLMHEIKVLPIKLLGLKYLI